MTERRTMIADRQARHRDAAAAILSSMGDALAPLEGMARTRGLNAVFEASPRAFTTARLVIAPDIADDVSLVMRANDCTLVTSMSVAIASNATIYFGAAHRVTGGHGEDFFLWHTERDIPLGTIPYGRVVLELRDQLFAGFDDAVQALLERAGARR
jgi:hypothetical protein